MKVGAVLQRSFIGLKHEVCLLIVMIKKIIKVPNLVNEFVTKHNSCFSAWASIITIISLPIILYQLISIVTYPDVELEFVHPSAIAYKVINHSSTIAEDTLVSFGIFDIDLEPPIMLPIPAQQIDYVNAESGKGPWKVLDKQAIKGHRYFGMMYIGCKEAKELKTYWIFTKHGDSRESFYVKRNKNDPYTINPSKVKIDEKYLEELVPLKRRIYIKE